MKTEERLIERIRETIGNPFAVSISIFREKDRTTATEAQQLYREPKKAKIKCPGCGVTYEVEKMETYAIRCMDCGAEYLQPIHNINNPEFIRAAAYRCGGER